LYKPYFVKSITDCNQNVIAETMPQVIKNTISNNTSEIMKQMMLDVIKQYSGYNAFIAGYDVGGKTGTTQKYSDGKISGEYIASFVGTFPAYNPDYVILITVDEPGGASYYGSIAATPYAKLVIEDIIKYKGYKPNENIESDLIKVNNKVSMPHLIGKNVYEAINELEKLGLQYEVQGEGDFISTQFPAPNTNVAVNSVVMIGF